MASARDSSCDTTRSDENAMIARGMLKLAIACTFLQCQSKEVAAAVGKEAPCMLIAAYFERSVVYCCLGRQ